MKLYTEEQVRESFKSGFRLAMETDGGLKEGQEEYINYLTPIELPSDEEIAIKSALLFPYAKYNQLSIESYNIKAFQQGAKWMKEQILRQLPIIKTNGTSTSQVDTNEIRN